MEHQLQSNQQKLPLRFALDYRQPGCSDLLLRHLRMLLGDPQFSGRPVLVLCIGSIRFSGDSLAPFVGTFLQEMGISCPVHGDIENPVHAGNLREVLRLIRRGPEYPVVIAVDACLGRQPEVGNIESWKGALVPGKAVGKDLPLCGDISITGVVNISGSGSLLELQTTPLNIVYRQARIIANAIFGLVSEAADTEAAVMVV